MRMGGLMRDRDTFVKFEAGLHSAGKAAQQRLGQVVLEHGVRVLDSTTLGPYVLLELPLPEAAAIREKLQPYEWRYRSPTRFDRGSLIPIYQHPEEQVANQIAERAKGSK